MKKITENVLNLLQFTLENLKMKNDIVYSVLNE
jgi:hypothetical protein